MQVCDGPVDEGKRTCEQRESCVGKPPLLSMSGHTLDSVVDGPHLELGMVHLSKRLGQNGIERRHNVLRLRIKCMHVHGVRCMHVHGVRCMHVHGVRCMHVYGVRCLHVHGVRCMHVYGVRCMHVYGVRCMHVYGVRCMHVHGVRCMHVHGVRCMHVHGVRCLHVYGVRCMHVYGVRCLHGKRSRNQVGGCERRQLNCISIPNTPGLSPTHRERTSGYLP